MGVLVTTLVLPGPGEMRNAIGDGDGVEVDRMGGVEDDGVGVQAERNADTASPSDNVRFARSFRRRRSFLIMSSSSAFA